MLLSRGAAAEVSADTAAEAAANREAMETAAAEHELGHCIASWKPSVKAAYSWHLLASPVRQLGASIRASAARGLCSRLSSRSSSMTKGCPCNSRSRRNNSESNNNKHERINSAKVDPDDGSPNNDETTQTAAHSEVVPLADSLTQTRASLSSAHSSHSSPDCLLPVPFARTDWPA